MACSQTDAKRGSCNGDDFAFKGGHAGMHRKKRIEGEDEWVNSVKRQRYNKEMSGSKVVILLLYKTRLERLRLVKKSLF